ncbi:tryptophan synthase beta subunit-like PLP-dependent enzyme [Dacryopinax primogenitus]|uniref:threonine synthase n=1 Tax=Dacryopinax primogenitus (strain DJM 731) TaxID=1858805 RepID=M5FXV9_DACPD|nr:tryptophan synthase beta subunit-like PLP-dependent enzyme [Dacryopinax primogenitus]EJU01349.1 tryptophan synthase beta subunit-like PLP-dependent enzyme [Dacryopinax primogenitus]
MLYFSTRGDGVAVSFEEAVLTGLAPDGGLFIPEAIPMPPPRWQEDWASYNFQQLSKAVISLFISESEISRADLRAIIERSYSTFRAPEITPLKKLNDHLYVLELFHGPTYAFKDVALQFLGNLFEFFLKRRNAHKAPGEEKEKLTVVGATSGDTGSAAIYGLRNKENISIFILHPKGKVSPIQEAQMTTVTDANVHNIAVQGTFDDCQDIVKALFGDREFNATHRLGAINSINWARILAQTVYYFLAYFTIRSQLPPGAEIQFVVPTGNFGDILAGYYAKKMGVPMAQLVVATNANDILARFWATGKYEKVDSASEAGAGEMLPANGASDGKQATDASGVKETLSPAMDILVSSNFERLLWYLVAESSTSPERVRLAGKTISEWMKRVKTDGRVAVPTEVLQLARRDFVARSVSDAQTLATIERWYTEGPYIADPHTAVGLTAVDLLPQDPQLVRIVLSTAHPAKFSDAVEKALSGHKCFNFETQVLPEEFKGLLQKPRRVIDVPAADIELVKQVIDREVEKMKTEAKNTSV